MPDFTLVRTDMIPVKITASHIATARSSNATLPGKESTSKQWFVIDVYLTVAKGTYVAHVNYAAGSKLGRENPVSRIVTAANPSDLIGALWATNIAAYVTGWPGAGEPSMNRGRDFRVNHESVMNHGRMQLDEAIDELESILGATPPVEEIL